MAKTSISSVELAALSHELQILQRGKISQIYHNKAEIFLQVHAPRIGKQLLRLVPGKFISITSKKETVLKPSSFCMQLRKYINNSIIKEVTQKDSERIIYFELEKQTTFYLIIELFSKGNVILTDDKFTIITAMERQIWKDRAIKPHEKYLFPTARLDWKKLTRDTLTDVLKNSEKKNLAITLATEIGLGGLYAEEICQLASVDKNLSPKIAAPHIPDILNALNELVKKLGHPQGYIYDDQITPLPLIGKTIREQTKTYASALDTINPFHKVSPYDKKIKAIEKTITEQKEAILKQKERIILNTKKAEQIYQNYAPLEKLLRIITKLRKTKEWKDVKLELQKEKNIHEVNLKTKTIKINLR